MTDDFITARIVFSRGLNLDVVAQTTTLLFKEGNTRSKDKAEAIALIQWLRDVADEWQNEFDSEFSA